MLIGEVDAHFAVADGLVVQVERLDERRAVLEVCVAEALRLARREPDV